MTRNPPSANPRRRARSEARAAAGLCAPDAATLARWRTELVARRGYARWVHPEFLRIVRRQGGWCGDRDLTLVSDGEIARLFLAGSGPVAPPPAPP